MNCKTYATAFTCVLTTGLGACGGGMPGAATAPAPAMSKGASLTFAPATRVLPDLGHGYEPTIVADRYGNLFSTAHKDNWELAAGPDTDSPTYSRSMSWSRMSVDGGKTWKEMPGLTALALEQHEAGDEGDMAFDDAGHLYYTDTYVVDSTLTRWTLKGPDQVSYDFTQPLIPTLQSQDDRPWIVAHGDGHVFYFANQPGRRYMGRGSGSGYGPGRYNVYASYDGGQTFDPFGYTLNESGYCRPAIDHTPGSTYVYAVCSNDAGKLYSYVSSDDGHTWERYYIADYVNDGSSDNWATLVLAPDGTLYALRPDGDLVSDDGRLMLYRSSDHGQSWTSQDVTPESGRYQFAWLAVSPLGKLGMSVYHTRGGTDPWHIFGAVWEPGEMPALVSADPEHPVAPARPSITYGDYTGSYFGPDERLHLVWNSIDTPVITTDLAAPELMNSVWYAHTQ